MSDLTPQEGAYIQCLWHAEKVLEKIRHEYENYPNVMTVGKYYQLRKEINELAEEMRQEVK